MKYYKERAAPYLSLAIDEFLDIDFGDISKSESDRYKKDSLRWGKFCSTSPPPEGDEPPGSRDDLSAGLTSFSTSNLQKENKKIHIRKLSKDSNLK